jgi:hypothetical protein
VKELLAQILTAAPELDKFTAERIATQLRERERPVSARAVADYLGLRKTDWMYANAERLGGRRLGDGPRPRWRFYLSEIDERLRDFGGAPNVDRRQDLSRSRMRAPGRAQAWLYDGDAERGDPSAAGCCHAPGRSLPALSLTHARLGLSDPSSPRGPGRQGLRWRRGG